MNFLSKIIKSSTFGNPLTTTTAWILLIGYLITVVQAVAFHDFVSNLSDQVNSLKRAFINIGNPAARSSRSSTFEIAAPLLTDPFVSRDSKQIRFRLYDKRLSPSEYQELRHGQLDLFSNVRKSKPVKVLVHGFNHNGTEGPGSFPGDAKNAYLENTENNVIIVDWGDLAKPKASGLTIDVFYPVVVSNVPKVGEEIGKLLVYMVENAVIMHPDQIHILGFSLGAHVAGVAGTYFKKTTGRFIGRITGLDPASPMFEQASDIERLDKTDADFVDVIHSSRLGLQDRIGHVDFYVNGGRFQVDCYQLSDKNPRQTFSDFYRAIMGSCSHSRAPLYYIHSIKSGQGVIRGCGCGSWRDFLSTCRKQCKGTAEFGEFCPHTARGVYFLQISVEDVNEK